MIKKWSDLWHHNLHEATKQIDYESPRPKMYRGSAGLVQKAPTAEESVCVCVSRYMDWAEHWESFQENTPQGLKEMFYNLFTLSF